MRRFIYNLGCVSYEFLVLFYLFEFFDLVLCCLVILFVLMKFGYGFEDEKFKVFCFMFLCNFLFY